MRPPAFQWYAADYLADEKVTLMSLEAEGAYIRLLSYCWREGTIPADEEDLSRLCKGASTTVIRVVIDCFQPCDERPGRLCHKRLEIEREKQAVWKAKSSAGGRKSAEKRWGKKQKGNHPCDGGVTLQSSSSSTNREKPIPPHVARGAGQSPVSREECVDYGKSPNCGMTETESILYFDTFEGKGWIDANGQPIGDWQARMRRWKTDNEGLKFAQKGVTNGHHAHRKISERGNTNIREIQDEGIAPRILNRPARAP